MTLKVLGICGSLRAKSTNMQLLRYAQDHTPKDMEIIIANLSQVPFYNADIQTKPPAVQTLLDQLKQADAVLFACPEYNYSLAPALKNAIDWASRETNNYLLTNKPVAIMGSGGGMGTSRAQYHLRQVCVYVNMYPLNRPEVFCNAFSGSFNENGELVDEHVKGLIKEQLIALQAWIEQLKK